MFFSRAQGAGSGTGGAAIDALPSFDDGQAAVLVVQKTPWARRLLMQLLIASVLTNVILAIVIGAILVLGLPHRGT